MKSIFFRSFLLTAALIFLSFLTLGVVFVSLATGYLADQRSKQLDANANAILNIGGFGFNGTLLIIDKNFLPTLTAVGTLSDATIFVANSNGKIAACSETNCLHPGKTLPDSVIQNILNARNIDAHALSGLLPDERITVGRAITSRTGYVGGYLVVSASAAGQSALLGGFTRLFLMAGLGVMLFSCLSAYWASRRMTRPLHLMGLASRRFAQGDFDIRIPKGRSADEIDELAEAFNAMADALQKAEALRSGFIANVSHELKTPMTTIAGFIDGILDGTIPRDKGLEYLSAIRSEVMRLSRLVSGMLNIARLQAGQLPAPRPFDIVDLLCRTLLSFEGAIERKDMRVETELPEEPVVVLADPDTVTQVVYNLLDNAIKYGGAGGQLWLGLRKKGGKLSVSVRNEGPDIPAEDLPYVFERFHKADKSRGMDKASLGLGLYIVKTILGNMRESITVTSGGGVTEFVFTLSEGKR